MRVILHYDLNIIVSRINRKGKGRDTLSEMHLEGYAENLQAVYEALGKYLEAAGNITSIAKEGMGNALMYSLLKQDPDVIYQPDYTYEFEVEQDTKYWINIDLHTKSRYVIDKVAAAM